MPIKNFDLPDTPSRALLVGATGFVAIAGASVVLHFAWWGIVLAYAGLALAMIFFIAHENEPIAAAKRTYSEYLKSFTLNELVAAAKDDTRPDDTKYLLAQFINITHPGMVERKIVQVAVAAGPIKDAGSAKGCVITAVCNDNTAWTIRPEDGGTWQKLPAIPQGF